MSIGLIAFDLDGTLLDEKKRISEQNLKALQVAADNGIYLVPCTARLFQTIPQEVRELPFIRYAITVNGAEVYDRDRDCAVCRAEIPAEEAEMLYDYMDKLPVIYDCYQQGRGWIDQHFYDNAEKLISDEYTLRLIRGMRTPVDNFRKTMRERKLPIQKTQMFFADIELKNEQMEQIKIEFPMYSVTGSLYNNIEINSGKANKGAALAALCDYLKIDLSECMALGDGNNDVSVLKMAGIGVAMGNAADEVKKAADHVTETNEESGVAKAIFHYALTC